MNIHNYQLVDQILSSQGGDNTTYSVNVHLHINAIGWTGY